MPKRSHKRTISKVDSQSSAESPTRLGSSQDLSTDSSTVSSQESQDSEDEYSEHSVEEEEEPLEFGKLTKLLKATNKSGRMWFDWTKLGISSYEEYNKLLIYASHQFRNMLFLNEAGTIQLSSPFLNTNLSRLSDTDGESSPEAEGPPEKKSKAGIVHGARTSCIRKLGPMCYKYLGKWENADLIGNFEKGLKPKLRAASLSHKYQALANINLEPEFMIAPDESEGTIRSKLEHQCLKKVAQLLGATGYDIDFPAEVNSQSIRGGELAQYTSLLKEDSFMVVREGVHKGMKTFFPLLPIEVKRPFMDHLVRSLRYHYWVQKGGREPSETASKGEQTQSVGVMTQLLQYCLAFGVDEIVLWDGVTATAIKFDLVEQKTGRRRFKRRKKTMTKEEDVAETMGEVGFWSRTTSYTSHKLPVSYLMAAMAWRQLKLIDDDESYTKRRKYIERTSKDLYMSADMLARIENKLEEINLEGSKKKHRSKKHQSSEDNEWGGSAAGKHVTKLKFEPIQDGDCIHRVVKMQRSEYQELFANVKSEAKSVVVKVLDLYNLEQYYDDHRSKELFDTDFNELWDECGTRYGIEVDCYKRIKMYNSMNEQKINVPEMLDFGFCCLEDDYRGSFIGLYIVMEDLGDCASPPEDEKTQKMIKEQLSLQCHIGITHGDVAPRNMTIKDGKLYFFDFERATLGGSHDLFV